MKNDEEYTDLVNRGIRLIQEKQREKKIKRTQQVKYAQLFLILLYDYFMFYNHFIVFQLVTCPELAAKRKIARQQKKKIGKRRRMDEMKGKV